MDPIIFEDKFAHDFLVEAYMTALRLDWHYQNKANIMQFPPNSPIANGSHCFLGARTFIKSGKYRFENNTPPIFLDILEHIVYKLLNNQNLELTVIDFNMQFKGQEGGYHQDLYNNDGTDRTILFYPHYEWKPEWGGSLDVVEEDGTIEQHELKPGKVLYFDGSVSHKANAPLIDNIPRISVAYRFSEK
jgi:hypothetical protein